MRSPRLSNRRGFRDEVGVGIGVGGSDVDLTLCAPLERDPLDLLQKLAERARDSAPLGVVMDRRPDLVEMVARGCFGVQRVKATFHKIA